MTKLSPGASKFNEALCSRVRELREAKEWTQEQMAEFLGIPGPRYIKYEKRSPLPMYLLPKLSALTQARIHWIITGTGPRQLRLVHEDAAVVEQKQATSRQPSRDTLTDKPNRGDRS